MQVSEIPKAAWLSVLSIERASYLRQFEQGLLTKEGFAALEAFMATLTADAGKAEAGKPVQAKKRTVSRSDTLAAGLVRRGKSGTGSSHTIGEGSAMSSNVVHMTKHGTLNQLYNKRFESLVAQLHKAPNTMTLRDRVLAYHVAKAYIIGQLDVKHAMALYRLTAADKKSGAHATAADVSKTRQRVAAVDAMGAVEDEHNSMVKVAVLGRP